MDKKWKVQNRKGYLKIHIAVDINTKEIVALEVTDDEKVHDDKMLKKLVDTVLDNNKKPNKTIIKIKSLLGDGAFDSNRNFRYLEGKGIIQGIKVRKNSVVVSPKNNEIRNKEVIRQQTKDLHKWKKI